MDLVVIVWPNFLHPEQSIIEQVFNLKRISFVSYMISEMFVQIRKHSNNTILSQFIQLFKYMILYAFFYFILKSPISENWFS